MLPLCLSENLLKTQNVGYLCSVAITHAWPMVPGVTLQPPSRFRNHIERLCCKTLRPFRILVQPGFTLNIYVLLLGQIRPASYI